MSGGEKALRFAAQALGGGTLLGVWVAVADIRRLGSQALGETAALLGVSLLLLLAVALAMKLTQHIRYRSALGRTATAYLSGAGTGLAVSVLILLLVELITAVVSMRVLRGFGG